MTPMRDLPHGAPAAPAPRGVSGLAPTRTVLLNGVTVLAKAAYTTPAVTLHASIRAGSVFDPPDLPGLAHFASRTIDRGTTRRTGDALAEDLEGRGVSLGVSASRHTLALSCTCLVEDVDAILALLGEIVMTPAFPPAEVVTRRGEIVTLIRQDADNPAAVAGDRLMATLYGSDHPYGRPVRGTLESVDRIDAAALHRFHAGCIVPGALSLAVVGAIDPDRAVDLASRVFGGWRGGDPPSPALPAVPPATARRVEVVPMMNKAQADIACGVTAIARADPSWYACALMNNILGQYSLGGRLGESIRERQGMAYYVFSAFEPSLAPGPLVIRAGINPANVERAVASIDAELARLVADGPTDEERAESTQYLIGSMPRTLETNAGIAQFLQTSELFGLGLDYDVRLPDRLRAVTRDEVHEVARRLLDPARLTVCVAGPYDGTLR
jgi:zinc protease